LGRGNRRSNSDCPSWWVISYLTRFICTEIVFNGRDGMIGWLQTVGLLGDFVPAYRRKETWKLNVYFRFCPNGHSLFGLADEK
jgi:hypothetical protein